MTDPPVVPPPTAPGTHERHIALSTIAQQASQAFGVLAMLVVVTIVGRSLTLSQFGVYGLLIAIGSYLLIVQTSVEGAAVRTIALAGGQADRDRVFSTALALYAALGLVAGAIIALAGIGLVEVLGIPDALHREAREGIVALGAATALGWPFKVFQDALRGSQRFVPAAGAEILANLVYVAGMAVLVAAGAPLWALIALGGSLPILIGVASSAVLLATRAPFRFSRAAVSRETAGSLLRFSATLSVMGSADLVIYALDRVVLGAFRPASDIGLYEGAARPHNLVRQLHATLVLTVVPVAAGYLAVRDEPRLHELLVRGTRYVLAVIVPVTVVLMVLSEPIMRVWLGDRFSAAATPMAVMLSYWLVAANTGVGGGMLVAAGRLRGLTRYAWTGAALNLALSLALTPLLGLEGVVLGTAIPYFVLFPIFMRLVLDTFPVPLRQIAREAWLPAYVTGAALAAALGVVRLLTPLDNLPAVLLAAAAGLAAAWGTYYLAWLRPGERMLVRALLTRRAAA